MTLSPKEKAKELVDKFYIPIYVWDGRGYDIDKVATFEAQKKCAIIACELRIDAYTFIPNGAMAWADKNETYYQQVKTEIENL